MNGQVNETGCCILTISSQIMIINHTTNIKNLKKQSENYKSVSANLENGIKIGKATNLKIVE